MAEILGVSAMADGIQRDPSQVQMVKEKGQVIFVWTDDRNDPETIKYLKELGINGLIYDRYWTFEIGWIRYNVYNVYYFTELM